jgi:hypothetical protein
MTKDRSTQADVDAAMRNVDARSEYAELGSLLFDARTLATAVVALREKNAKLLKIAFGEVTHSFVEFCPSPERPDSRDPQCPACQILLAIEGEPPIPDPRLSGIGTDDPLRGDAP